MKLFGPSGGSLAVLAITSCDKPPLAIAFCLLQSNVALMPLSQILVWNFLLFCHGTVYFTSVQ